MNPDAVLDLKTALVAAARDPSARARAIGALRGVEVWAAIWPQDPTLFRTLTSSERVTALPLFTDERELHEAGVRYGWLGVDGQVSRRLVPLWEGMRAAKRQNASMLVLDIASEHALELDEGEMDLLSAAPSTRPPLMSKVRSTPPPPADLEVLRASSRPDEGPPTGANYSALRPRSVTPLYGAHKVAATFGAVPVATMEPLDELPDEQLLDELEALLRDYPEVEWACLVASARVDGSQVPSVALRVVGDFRKNLLEISQKLRETSSQHGLTYDVLMLETSEQMKQARQIGVPFYPWRK